MPGLDPGISLRAVSACDPRVKPAGDGFSADLGDHLIGGALAAIAFDRAEREVVALLGVGGAGIGHLCDEITEIAGIANGALDALVGDDAAEDELLYPELAQDVVDMGRDE